MFDSTQLELASFGSASSVHSMHGFTLVYLFKNVDNIALRLGVLGLAPCLLASKSFEKTEVGATWGLRIAAPEPLGH